MNKRIFTLLKRLSFEICEGCPKRSKCDAKITESLACKKRDVINKIVTSLREVKK